MASSADALFTSGDGGHATSHVRRQVMDVTVVSVDGGAVATAALRSNADEHGIRYVKAFIDALGVPWPPLASL